MSSLEWRYSIICLTLVTWMRCSAFLVLLNLALSFLLHYFCSFVKPGFAYITAYTAPFAWNALIIKPCIVSSFSYHNCFKLESSLMLLPASSHSQLRYLLWFLLENLPQLMIILFMFVFFKLVPPFPDSPIYSTHQEYNFFFWTS